MKNGLLLSLSLMLILMPMNLLAADVKPKENKVAEPITLNELQAIRLQSALKVQPLALVKKPTETPAPAVTPEPMQKAEEQPQAAPQPQPIQEPQPVAPPAPQPTPAVQETPKAELKKETFSKPNIPLSDDVQSYIVELSTEFNIPYYLIIAIVKQESDFKANLQSHNSNGTTDYGLMQLNNGGTMQWLAKSAGINNFNWSNPKHNLRAGVWYLRYLKDNWTGKGYGNSGNINYLTALSFNMGLGNAYKYVGSHDVFNWEYVKKISQYEKKLKAGKEM